MQSLFRISAFFQKKPSGTNSLWSKVFQWRWISIFLLGICSNTLVNAVLDLKYQRPLLSMSWEEYVNAILAGWLLLTGTRWISARLDRKISWAEKPVKRLFVQMGLHLLFIAGLFNLVLIGITDVFYGGAYELDDVVVIDICVVAMSFLFSSIDSSISFFANWKQAQTDIEASEASEDLKLKPIEILLGKSRHLVAPADVRIVRTEQGMVYLCTTGQRLLYSQSLESLMELLDSHSFFRANRQIILHRSVIKSFSSMPQGKVKVNFALGTDPIEHLTVSRTKAASFRQWIKQH